MVSVRSDGNVPCSIYTAVIKTAVVI